MNSDLIEEILKLVDGNKGLEKAINLNYLETTEIIKLFLVAYNEERSNNSFKMSINDKEYIDCYFKVSTYETNNLAMCITVYGKEKSRPFSRSIPISNATVFSSKVLYNKTNIALKEEYLDIFRKLDIVKVVRSINVVSKDKARTAMDYTDRPFMICEIDQEKLKKYCKDWNYQFE